jgi:ABC-type molybdate transport system permease subunit
MTEILLDPSAKQAIVLSLQLSCLTTLCLLALATPLAWWLLKKTVMDALWNQCPHLHALGLTSQCAGVLLADRH